MGQGSGDFAEDAGWRASKIAVVIATSLLVVGVLFAARYPGYVFCFVLVGPAIGWLSSVLIFHRTSWMTTDPSTTRFDPDSPELPEAVANAIRCRTPSLESLGYVVAAHFFRSRPTQFDCDLFVSLFVNHKSGQGAWLCTIIPRRQFLIPLANRLVFVTEFADATVLTTSDNDVPIFSQIGFREGSMGFPKVRDPRRLYHIHQATLKRDDDDVIRRDLSLVDPIDYQKEVAVREFARFLEAGYYTLDESQQRYRPAWKYDFLMNARLFMPFAPMLAMVRKWQRSRFLRGLDLHEPTHESRVEAIFADRTI
jgi:hypothetical protein